MNYGFDEHEDEWQCKFCGQWYSLDWTFCCCDESRKASEKERIEDERRYKGDGWRRKGKITIEYDCYDTKEAFNAVMTAASLNSFQLERDNEGYDSVLECGWKVEHKKV